MSTYRSKKSKRSKQLQKKLTIPGLLDRKISHAQHQILQGDFAGAISTCEPLLSNLPRRSSLRVEALTLLGLAHGMSQNFERSYNLFTEALTIDPTNAELWYNHGLACRFTTRMGQAVRDFGQAVKLSGNDSSELARKFARELEVSREELQKAIEEQGGTITLDQVIEREEHFILGKTCRYCTNCDLLIVHQDRLEEQLAAYFSTTNPDIIGNDYLVMGTLHKPEWKQGMQDPLTMQEMIEHLHDFKEAITFKPGYV